VFHCPALPYGGRWGPAADSFPLHSESKSTAAGFVSEAVKRCQPRYKLDAGDQAGAGTYTRGHLAGWVTLAAKFQGFDIR